MPGLDYMFICDSVRAEGGVFHALAIGVERVGVAQVPAVVPLSIAARLTFGPEEVSANEVRTAHVAIVGPDGQAVFEVQGTVTLKQPPGMPDDWPTSSGLVMNLLLAVQQYGEHRARLELDGEVLKTIRFLVHQLEEG